MIQMLKNSVRRLSSLFSGKNAEYSARLVAELKAYEHCENVHDLPEIFHYWSNKHVVPLLQPFGFSSPDAFFYTHLEKVCLARQGEPVHIVSIGAGNCDLEIKLAKQLSGQGCSNFQIDCIDLNPDMLDRGLTAARDGGVQTLVRFWQKDFNLWVPEPQFYDAVVANQSLHHVIDLEHLFDSVSLGLKPGAVFLISDMIGRNGHMRWPEALTLVQEFWKELPESYRFNQLMKRQEIEYINHDCSTEGFEGIRAQDILPLLSRRFSFDFFFPYGNVIFPFVDRAFGHNFSAEKEWDRNFIDRIQELDESRILAGEITPNAMIAVLQIGETSPVLRHPNLTPEACIRRP